MGINTDWIMQCKILGDENERLKSEIHSLRKDKASLDWLADPNNKIGHVQLPVECVERNMHSLRAAIDAAMEIKDE